MAELQDWQFNRSLLECNKYMFEKQLMCDIIFEVGTEEDGTEKIAAHQYILISRSPVFFTMFHGELQENCNDPILVPDVEPDAFRQMLRFLYTDICELTFDTVLPTLYASKKYMIPALTAACVQFLEENMNAENVCLIMEQTSIYEEASLTQKCDIFIETHSDEVFRSASFKNLSQKTLHKLLTYSSLTLSELDVFFCCCDWAEEECHRRGLEVTVANKRAALGDCLYHIHFPAIPIKDFSKHVSRSGMLSAEEACGIFEYLASDSDESFPVERVPFPKQPRMQLDPCILQRFKNFCRSVVWSGNCSTFKVTVDTPIIVKGFGFSGSRCYDPVSEVKFTINQGEQSLLNTSIAVKDDHSGETIKAFLPRSICFKPDVWYSVSISVYFFREHDQGYCRRGKAVNGENDRVIKSEGVTFEFDKNDTESGFILEILFCK